LFKHLCSTNQEKKFYELWQKLDDLTKKASEEIAKKPISIEPGEEPFSLEDVGLDAINVKRRRGHAVKTFSQCIQNEPKAKWCLLFDKGGVRHEIMTTNFAEVYNAVLHGARALPLVGIIEFFLYRTMKYFLERATTTHATMQHCQKVYSTWMTEYLITKQKVALAHRAYRQPLRRDPDEEVQWKYQINCQSKSQEANGEITTQKTATGNQTCSCSCKKPLLLHYPCSHVIAACLATKNKHWGRYVPKYFLKQTILDTWNHIIEGYLHLGTLTQDPKDSVLYIPNPNLTMCQGVGRRKKNGIRTNMDEAETGPRVQICSKCNNPGHSNKKYTEASYFFTATSPAPSASACGCRSRRYNEGMQ
jgi:hypothetical protein